MSQPRSGSTWVLSKIATHACVVSRSESGHAMWGSSGGGGGSCKQAACFEGEPAGSSVCYGLAGASNKNVEEEWTVVDRDPEDEVPAVARWAH